MFTVSWPCATSASDPKEFFYPEMQHRHFRFSCHQYNMSNLNIYEVMMWGSKRMSMTSITLSIAYPPLLSTIGLPLPASVLWYVDYTSVPLAPTTTTTQLPLHSPVHRAPPSLTVPPIWLEQWMQAGQPSRSLSKAAEYSSSLGVSPPPLRPGLGPFNKEQVIHMEEGGGVRLQGVGGRWRPFLSFFYFCFFVPRLCRQSALVNIFLVFVVLTQ